jgi:hypothetical protein
LLIANNASATLFDVELVNASGPHILGQVDTLTDTFTITAWTENPLGTAWWSPSDLPRTYVALTGSGPFDVPDAWDGTIGTDWAFINSQTLSEAGWINGAFSPLGPTLIRDGWGGGVNGSGAIDTSFTQTVWTNVPFTLNSVAPLGFNSVTVSVVPEPSTLTMAAVGAILLALIRRGRD